MSEERPSADDKRALDRRLRLVATYCRIHELPLTGPHVDALMQMSDDQFERMVMGDGRAGSGEA